MKRLLTIVLILILLSSTIAPLTASASGLTFTAGSGVAARGTPITLPITVSGNTTGFSAVVLTVRYDNTKLDLLGVDGLIREMPVTQFEEIPGDGTGWISQWILLGDPFGSGNWICSDNTDLVNLRFRVRQNAALGETPITLSFSGAPAAGNPVNRGGSFVTAFEPRQGILNIVDTAPTPPPPPGPEEFQLIVIGTGTGGTQSANHTKGVTVGLNAGTPPSGQTFLNWSVIPNTLAITNPTSPTTASIAMPEDVTSIPSRIITVTANWSGSTEPSPSPSPGASPAPSPGASPAPSPGASPAPSPGASPSPGTGGASPSPGAGGASPSPSPGQGGIAIISHFGTWTGAGTSTARVDADHNRFVRLTKAGVVIDSTHYTVTAGSTVITLNEPYIRTLTAGTHTYRAEFQQGYADLNLIISTDFGRVPQTGVMDITGAVVIMWVSILLTVSLSAYLLWHIKIKSKRADSESHIKK